MKKLLTLLLLLFAGTSYLLESVQTENSIAKLDSGLNKNLNNSKALYKVEAADYFINAELFPDEKIIEAEAKIIWRNRTQYPTDEIHLNFFLNAFNNSNNKAEYAAKIKEESKTSIEVSMLKINGVDKKLIYYAPIKEKYNDSTAAKIILDKNIQPNDSIEIKIIYSFKIPKSFKNAGYASGSEFYFISDWYPKVGVYEKGEWKVYPYFYYAGVYSDFANYNVKITVPKLFSVDASADKVNISEHNGRREYHCILKGKIDFAWFAVEDIFKIEYSFRSRAKKEIAVIVYTPEQNNGMSKRCFEAVENSLEYLENNFAETEINRLVVLDIPRTNMAQDLSYPNLITIKSNLISPIELLEPEKTITRLVAEQYFKYDIAINGAEEKWLGTGLADYVSGKILQQYYPPEEVHFKLISSLPIPGLIFASYNEIPIIYTLGSFELPEAFKNISLLTKQNYAGSISDKTFTLPDENSAYINSVVKPSLMLTSLERYLGYEQTLGLLSKYYNSYKNNFAAGLNFWNIVQTNTEEDLNWFIKNIYEQDAKFNYRAKEIIKSGKSNYKIFLQRTGDGIFKTDFEVYTKQDTLKFVWNGKEKWKIIELESDNEIIAVNLDPKRKNVFDINYADNSYTINSHYAGALSLSVRWLFWVQNALMVLGSIG